MISPPPPPQQNTDWISIWLFLGQKKFSNVVFIIWVRKGKGKIVVFCCFSWIKSLHHPYLFMYNFEHLEEKRFFKNVGSTPKPEQFLFQWIRFIFKWLWKHVSGNYIRHQLFSSRKKKSEKQNTTFLMQIQNTGKPPVIFQLECNKCMIIFLEHDYQKHKRDSKLL